MSSPPRFPVGSFVLVLMLSFGFVYPISYLAGGVFGDLTRYQMLFQSKMAKISPILTEEPYINVEPSPTSTGGVYMSGIVPTQVARDSLQERLQDLFGSEEAARMISGVKVNESGKPMSSP